VKKFEDDRENVLGDLLASLKGVSSVHKNFGFDDRDKSVLLADRSVSGESVSVFVDSELGGFFVGDLEDGSPFGESSASSVVLLASFG